MTTQRHLSDYFKPVKKTSESSTAIGNSDALLSQQSQAKDTTAKECLTMTKNMAELFNQLHEDKTNWHRAVDLLCLLPAHQATVTVFRKLLHEIVLNCDDEQTLSKAIYYSSQQLHNFPPCNNSNRKYYEFVLFKNHLTLSMWDVVHQLANKILKVWKTVGQMSKQEASKTEKRQGNRIALLRFIIEVLDVDKSYVISSKDDKSKSLIQMMFWPSTQSSCRSYKCSELMKLIDEIFAFNVAGLKLELLQILGKFLCSVAEMSMFSNSQNEIDVIRCGQNDLLVQIIEEIRLSSYLNGREHFELFMNSTPLTWFCLLICENLLRQDLYQSWAGCVLDPLSLKKILFCYMIPKELSQQTDENCWESAKNLNDEQMNAQISDNVNWFLLLQSSKRVSMFRLSQLLFDYLEFFKLVTLKKNIDQHDHSERSRIIEEHFVTTFGYPPSENYLFLLTEDIEMLNKLLGQAIQVKTGFGCLLSLLM